LLSLVNDRRDRRSRLGLREAPVIHAADQVAQIPARSAQLLRASLVVAISDDLAIENWIKATYRGDTAAADGYWQQQLALSSRATSAKSAFLSVYNAKRSSLLGLSSLDVAY
jgi:hypothetical protein